jgi:CDP-glucose 4,6-dehydratase
MENLFNDIYKDKKVLVTGHTGFKGSWLTLWLSLMGANVVGYSKDLPTDPNHFSLLNLPIESITGDVLDKEMLFSVIERVKPDIIFHLAAQPLVRKSYNLPALTIETNIVGTLNVLESVRKLGTVKAVVNITSDKCYKNNEQIWGYRENDPMGGDDPYSASKGASELISQAYRKSFFKPDDFGTKHHTLIANVRAGNVIGGGDWAEDRLIPDMMKAVNAEKKVIIRNPDATRPWQHVLEPLSGYLLIGSHLLQGKKIYSDDWNFGPQNDAGVPVIEVVSQAQKHWDKLQYEIKRDPNAHHESHLLTLDSTKARLSLGWKNVWTEKTTFEKTVTWYKDFYTKKNVVSRDDLEQYIKDAQTQNAPWA